MIDSDEQHSTRVLDADQAVPSGYVSLVYGGGSRGDEEWGDAENDDGTCFRDPQQMNPPANTLTVAGIAPRLLTSSNPFNQYLVGVLLAIPYVRATWPAESPGPGLPDWSHWHALRQKAEQGTLCELEAEQLSKLSAWAKELDEAARTRQARALQPILQRHDQVLNSLAHIAALLSQVIEESAKPSSKPGRAP
ncbi:MAG: hypothetical protein C4547_11520 [Phycisphaerales bacterium]|nr:MAG: hypothetical protein C4547_11520 [Phycisphaerales bacterium]